MSRDEKDQFRLGIDQLMHNKISPILLHFQFDLQDIPVVRYHTGDQGQPRMVVIPDLFVLGMCCLCHRYMYVLSLS